MRKAPNPVPPGELKICTSAAWLAAGHCLSVSWEVTGLDESITNVQLARAGETGLEMIESVPRQGARQMIFSRPGMVTFTLIASYGDGVKQSRQIQIQVMS